jgi:hypothetical protein
MTRDSGQLSAERHGVVWTRYDLLEQFSFERLRQISAMR